MKSDLRFCLIGRGSIGLRHLINIKALSYNNIFVYSESSDKDEEFKVKYNVNTLHNLDEVREHNPDIFIIANPTSRHVEFAKIAISMNCHIFMEKPISHNLEDMEMLKKEISERKLVFLLANNLRFHPGFIKIKELVEGNKLGDIYFARIMAGQYLPDWHLGEDYRQSYSAKEELGGGVVLTLQHEIDFAYWFFGKFEGLKSYVKRISNLQIDVEDIASIIIETISGPLIEIHLDYLQRPSKMTIHIQGSKGSIDYSLGDKDLQFYDFNQQEYRDVLNLNDYDNNQMYIDEMEHFIECVVGKQTPRINIEDAIYTLNMCLKVKKNY